MPIENLDLTVRVFNSLKRTGITTVGDVLELLDKGEEAILSIRNFGEKSLAELKEKLSEKGFLEEEEEDETTES
jgi:DNA-directed RNA polymerase subunit alpha